MAGRGEAGAGLSVDRRRGGGKKAESKGLGQMGQAGKKARWLIIPTEPSGVSSEWQGAGLRPGLLFLRQDSLSDSPSNRDSPLRHGKGFP